LALAVEPGFLGSAAARRPRLKHPDQDFFSKTAVRANASIKWLDEAMKWEKLWKELFLPVR
jgi:hypothetical protein